MSEATKQTQNIIRELDFFRARRILYGFYGENSTLLPNSTSMTFPNYENIFNGSCFFSREGIEKYQILKRND